MLTGHSAVAMALAFDLENRLLSASADGCLFIWLLHHRIADDSKVAHYLNNNNSNSAATTSGSPGPDRTACFEEATPENKPKNPADELETTGLFNLSPAERSPSFAAAVVTASKDLVNKVIASVENEQHENGSATKISESNLESCNAAVLNCVNRSKTEANFAFNHQNPLQDISHHGKHESRVRSPRKTSLQESNYQNDEFEGRFKDVKTVKLSKCWKKLLIH